MLEIKKLQLINEQLILNFPYDNKKSFLRYKINSSLNALDNMNEMQENFINTIDDKHGKGALLLRLYGLVQGLFVAIDALYDLAYGITNSKNIININQNHILRELKYIRNDVVGHPTHRVYENTIGYCILNKDDITNRVFSYKIIECTKTTCEEAIRYIDLVECLENYYLEANKLLSKLSNIEKDLVENKKVSDDIKILLDMVAQKDFCKQWEQFKNKYNLLMEKYERFMWRSRLIDILIAKEVHDKLLQELINYMISYELEKLNQLVMIAKNNEVGYIKLPYMLKVFYRFMKDNPDFIHYLSYLNDATHPLFKVSLHKFLDNKKICQNKTLLALFNFINELYIKKENDLIYTIGSKLKNYRHK